MNLRSARHFYWKQSGDLVLSYLVTKENSGANNSTNIADDNSGNHNSTSTFLINNLHNTTMSRLKEDGVSDSNDSRSIDDINADEH